LNANNIQGLHTSLSRQYVWLVSKRLSQIQTNRSQGINASTAYGIALGGTGIAFVGTCLSWLLIPRFGRRTIFLTGFSWVVISLFLIAILACIPTTGHGIPYTQAALAVSWLAIYSMTVGPIV